MYNTNMYSLPTTVQNVLYKLNEAHYQAYIVGGSVRDILMNKSTNDWDFTTDAKPEDILKIFPNSFYDNCFGTVGIKIYETGLIDKKFPKGDPEPKVIEVYEITTFRSEHGYSDFRHPDKITWGTTLEEDLSRRDFTINAIAYDGNSFIDPYNGKNDIENKLIKTVGNADDRIREDALRMMRAIRIAAQLGFMIDEDTQKAISENAVLIEKIAVERTMTEIIKLMSSDYPADGILIMKNTGILKLVLPELDICFDTPQKSPKRHHVYDVGTHSVMALKNCPSKDPIVRLATLLHDIGKPPTFYLGSDGVITFHNHEVVGTRMCKKISQRLRLSNKQTEKLLTLVRWHQFSVDERQTDSAIRRIIRRVGKENLNDMLDLRVGDRLGGGARETSWRLELFKKRLDDVQKQPFSIKDLQINGVDVMNELDIKPGPKVGQILKNIFDLVEIQKIPNERDILLEKIKELN